MIGLGGPTLGLSEKLAVWAQLSSGKLAQGEQVAKLEKSFAAWLGAKNAIAVNSGTSALHIGNLALGLGPGDEVIVPSFTFAASANSVALTGATPVFCDVDPIYFTLDSLAVEKLITPKTKAIMTVHLFGQMSDMTALKALADKHDLFLIEDAAQAHGASLNGVGAGSWGDYAAFSFYPTKNMTTGEGGAITTASEDLVRMARLLRNQGMLERYRNEVVGLNNRMTEIAAVIGLAQLQRIDGFNSKRIRNASILTEELCCVPGIELPVVRPNSTHVFHQYTILVAGDRDAFASELRLAGVDSGTYYPVPIHKLPAFASSEVLPVSDYLSKHCLSLPVHPSLSPCQIRKVAKAVRQVVGR
jgi:dTDP-4-amino-4,6-dideoxygalactose transaminase